VRHRLGLDPIDQNLGVLLPVSLLAAVALAALHLEDRDLRTPLLGHDRADNAGTRHKRGPDAVRAFVAGWIETVDYIRTHKAETVKIESAITGFSESVLAKDYDLTVGMFTKACRFDAESLATLKQSFVDLNLVPSTPDMAKLYTEQFLPK